jgi:hypothetical protein
MGNQEGVEQAKTRKRMKKRKRMGKRGFVFLKSIFLLNIHQKYEKSNPRFTFHLNLLSWG